MGSKARVAKEIADIINYKNYDCYIEPFCGGCNMIDKIDHPERIANDSNPYLIGMWKELQEGWVPREYSKEEYIEVRDNKELHPDYLIGWIGFNCSYSGKFFGGYAGKVKTKIGTERNYQKEAIKNVLNQIPLIQGVKFYNQNYLQLHVPDDSIVYCDPPYQGTTGYSEKFNHEEFWDWVRAISKKSTVFISEYSAPKDFKCVWEKSVKSSLSANGKIGGNKNSVERLFVI